MSKTAMRKASRAFTPRLAEGMSGGLAIDGPGRVLCRHPGLQGLDASYRKTG
jgi:hypothetical protein